MRFISSLFLVFMFQLVCAQKESGAKQFWNTLKQHCGKTFEGTITAGATPNDPFVGKKLVMHVRSCEENRIRIPFFVGDDKSRTWVLTFDNDQIQLKHDHRHEDGSEDKITQYGGKSPNSGLPNIQKKDLVAYPLNLPSSIKEQQKIANFLSSIDVKIESTSQQINQTQSFKKGLLQQLFV